MYPLIDYYKAGLKKPWGGISSSESLKSACRAAMTLNNTHNEHETKAILVCNAGRDVATMEPGKEKELLDRILQKCCKGEPLEQKEKTFIKNTIEEFVNL